MDHKMYSKDPTVLVKAMESYFKNTPPDCNLYSQDNYGVLIHKELLYQTKFMRDMVKSVSPDSKIEIICHSLSKEEVEVIVEFLYNGKILCTSEVAVHRVAKNLRDLFGFPLAKYEISEVKDKAGTGRTVKSVIFGSSFSSKLQPEMRKKQRKQTLNMDSIRDDFPEPITKLETVEVKQQFVLNGENEVTEKEYKYKISGANWATGGTVKKSIFDSTSSSMLQSVKRKKQRKQKLNVDTIRDDFTGASIVNLKKENGCDPLDVTDMEYKVELLDQEINNINLRPVKVNLPELGEESPKERQKRLSQYIKTDSKTGLEACNFCHKKSIFSFYQGNKLCTNLGKLMDHIDIVHLKLKSFECQFCDKNYPAKSQLGRHLKLKHSVDKDKIVKCPLCEKDVNDMLTLKRHFREVHKKKDYSECPICKDVFESQASKMEHVGIKHPERKIHCCQHCDFKCLKLKMLQNHHSQKHPGQSEPKFSRSCRVCSVCKIDFQSRIRMIEHCISNHPDIKVHSCPFCNVKYLQGIRLEKHVSQVHPEHESNISLTGKEGSHRMCPICKIVFKSRSLMMKHLTSVHPEEKIYSCSLCNFKFRGLHGLNYHVFNCHERKVTELGCSFCGKEFASKMDLKNHITTEHKEKRYECSKCEASYLNQTTLLLHIEQVHEGKKHQCTTCGEIFETMNRLETHIAVKHDRSKLFECSSCKAVYTTNRKLKDHVAYTHEKVSGHLCPDCGKNFQSKNMLRDHILVVHEGKKYHCDLCPKTFKNKCTLQSHVSQIHKGNKPPPVKCSQCQKSFSGNSRNAGLKRHISEVHEGKRPYACHICGLAFSQSGNLKTHIKGKHKDSI